MPNVSNYKEQGGARTVIGGSLDVASGGDLDIESGAAFKIAGSEISSTEFGYIDGVTAGTQAAGKAVVADSNVNTGVSKVTQLHIGTSGSETQVTATGAELNLLDGSVSTSAQASVAVIADANLKINFGLIGGGAAVSASGLLAGVGTSANPVTTSTANAKWLEIRAQTTATSGDNRLAYLRYDINGAAAGGECLRAFTDLTAAASTAHGAHISLQAGTTGYISGLGVGVRGQLYIKDEAVAAAGTYYGAQAEIYCAGSSSSLAAVTKHAVFSIAATGDATGMATVLNALSVDGTTAADATKMISSVSLAELPANSVAIACLINGTRYYIPAVLDSELN